MPTRKATKATWQLSKPRLHETAAIKLVTRRQENGLKDNKKIRRQLKLSLKDHLAELDTLLMLIRMSV